ncbi:MAG: Uma2 family endonuclease [Bryobacteraceae bacterium]|jgi:Uma2 family endonuclease
MAAITTVTGTQFDAMPYAEGRKWELVNGELISVSSPTPRHQDIVFEILLAVRRYLEQSKATGLAYQDVEFAISDLDRVRPDVCVLLGDNAARMDPERTPIPGAPDIAIEVISPSERASESYDKVRAYLRNGTTEVWQIYPKSRTVQIHRGETARSLEWSQGIETDLLPGFGLQLALRFA